MPTFTAYSKTGEVLNLKRVVREGRNRAVQIDKAAFGAEEPNGFALCVQACAQNGGGVVKSDAPLQPSGESAWAVDADASYRPVTK